MKARKVFEAINFERGGDKSIHQKIGVGIYNQILEKIENDEINLDDLSIDNIDHENFIITCSKSWETSTSETMLFFDWDQIKKHSEFFFEIKLIINLKSEEVTGTGSVTHENIPDWELTYGPETSYLDLDDIINNNDLGIEDLVTEIGGSMEYGNAHVSSLESYMEKHYSKSEDDEAEMSICAFCGEEFELPYPDANDICDECSDDDDEDY